MNGKNNWIQIRVTRDEKFHIQRIAAGRKMTLTRLLVESVLQPELDLGVPGPATPPLDASPAPRKGRKTTGDVKRSDKMDHPRRKSAATSKKTPSRPSPTRRAPPKTPGKRAAPRTGRKS